jgi:hypothetical protein
MKNYARILLATAFLGLGLAAQAEIRQEVSVTVPFSFVANGRTLPAGTYKVGRLSGDLRSAQLFRNRDKNVAVFVNPVEAENTNVDMPVVRFKQVGNQFFLSSIQTEDNVFNFHVSRSANPEVAARSSNNVSISGAPTSN